MEPERTNHRTIHLLVHLPGSWQHSATRAGLFTSSRSSHLAKSSVLNPESFILCPEGMYLEWQWHQD